MKRKVTISLLKAVLCLYCILPFGKYLFAQTVVTNANFASCLHNNNPNLFTTYDVPTENFVLDDTAAASHLTIVCIGNGITDLQGIQAFTGLDYVNLSNNELTFNELNLMPSSIGFASYSPQANLSIDAMHEMCPGESWTYNLSTSWDDTSGNQYRWYKNNSQVSSSFNYNATTAGTYHGTITNSAWPNLILSTTEIEISLVDSFDEVDVTVENEMNDVVNSCENTIFAVDIINNSTTDLSDATLEIILPNNVEYAGIVSASTANAIPVDYDDSNFPIITIDVPNSETVMIQYEVFGQCGSPASVGSNTYDLNYTVSNLCGVNDYAFNYAGFSYKTRAEEIFVYKAFVEESNRIYDDEEFIMSIDLVGNALGKDNRTLSLTIGYDCGLNWDEDLTRFHIGSSMATLINHTDNNDGSNMVTVEYDLPLDGFVSEIDALTIHPRFVADQCDDNNVIQCPTNFFGIIETPMTATASVQPTSLSPCNGACTATTTHDFERTIFQTPCFNNSPGGCSGVTVNSYELQRISNFGTDVCDGVVVDENTPNINLERVGENDVFQETYNGTVVIISADAGNTYDELDVRILLHNGNDLDFDIATGITSVLVNSIAYTPSNVTNNIVQAVFREIRFTIDYSGNYQNGDVIEVTAEYTLNSNINNSIGSNTIEMTGMADFYLKAGSIVEWKPSQKLNNIDLVGKEKVELPLKEITISNCSKKYEYTENYFVGRDYNYDTFIHEYREWFGNNFMYSPAVDPDFAYIDGTARIIIEQADENGIITPFESFIEPTNMQPLAFNEDLGSLNCDLPMDDSFTLKLFFQTEYSPLDLVADAGPDQLDACSETTTLAANTPPATYEGVWTVASGPITNASFVFSSTTNPTTTLKTTIPTGDYLLVWTVSEPRCDLEISDTIAVNIHIPLPDNNENCIIAGCDFICSGDVSHIYHYSVTDVDILPANVDDYTWSISPAGAATILNYDEVCLGGFCTTSIIDCGTTCINDCSISYDANPVCPMNNCPTAHQNYIYVKFDNLDPNNPDLANYPNGTIGDINISLTVNNNCSTVTYDKNVMYDTECIWPGDTNYDGVVLDAPSGGGAGNNSWISDALALTAGEHEYRNVFLPNNPTYTSGLQNCDDYPNHRDLPCIADNLTEWEAYPSLPWNHTFSIQDNGVTRQIDLKHVDANGDGNITSGNNIGSCTDFDVIADRIRNNPDGEHDGNAHVIRQNVNTPLTVEYDANEDALIVSLGTPSNPVSNVKHLAFTIDISAGNALSSTVNYSYSDWDFSIAGGGINKYDFTKITNTSNTRHYIAIGQRDTDGVTFAGNEICRIECIVNPVTWIANNFRTGEITSIPLTATVIDGGFLKNGNVLDYTTTGSSVTFEASVTSCDSTYAAFASSDTTIVVGTTVQFTNESTASPNYVWLHNGDTVATTTDFSFTFNEIGTDTITLFASNDSCAHVYQEVIEITEDTSCEQPTNPEETNLSCSSVTLEWDQMPNADVYRLRGRKAGRPFKVFPDMTNNFRTFTGGLKPSTTYEWHIRARCGDTWTSYTPLETFTTPSCKNSNYDAAKDPFLVNETENSVRDLHLYPNPTRDFVQLAYTINSFEQLKTSEILDIQMIDITGKVVLEQQLVANSNDNLFTLDISQLQKGQYFVNLTSENTQIIDKLIVW